MERRVPAAGSAVPARTLMFNYDENNSPVGFQFKSDVSNYWYFYVFAKNAQGDITSIYRRDVDANGKTYLSHIADYEYDPWGRVLSVKDSSGRDISNGHNNSAAINPFRYRGYYYDTESGFYYLQSRYYDPVIKRFINADSFASTGTGYLGYNMFAYCCNNAIVFKDDSGCRMMCATADPDFSGSGGGYEISPVSSMQIYGGLDLPVSGGTPVEIDGTPFYYWCKYNSKGELYEYWYDTDRNLVRVRHHSDHQNKKNHKNPHDHLGTKDAEGNNTEGKQPLSVDPKFTPPSEKIVNQNRTSVGDYLSLGIIAFGAYEVIKWAGAAILSPVTVGGSFGVAAVLP